VEELSVADSALCLDITEALVRKRLSRAREMLREALLREMAAGVSEVFGFAGKRCDAVTAGVMAGLYSRGMIRSE
jgi:RNA polymerase sigma-70 factor (ECF subfamily)